MQELDRHDAEAALAAASPDKALLARGRSIDEFSQCSGDTPRKRKGSPCQGATATTKRLRAAIAAGGAHTAVCQAPADLLSVPDMKVHAQQVLAVTDEAQYLELVDAFRKSATMYKQFKESCKKSHTTVTGHFAARVKARNKVAPQQKAKVLAAEVAQAKALPRQAASRTQAELRDTKPFFKTDFAKLSGTTALQIRSGVSSESSLIDASKPCLVVKFQVKAIEQWLQNAQVQHQLYAFGGNYKKLLSADEETGSQGRSTQRPLHEGAGLEEYNEMFSTVVSTMFEKKLQIDASSLNPVLAKVCGRQWHWGYEESYCSVGTAPQSMCMLKALAEGSIRWVFMDAKALVPLLQNTLEKEKVTMKEALHCIENADQECLASWMADEQNPLNIFTGVQQKHDMIYVPAGWILAEQVISGPLIYGARASFNLCADALADSYEAIMGLFAGEGKPSTNWEIALNTMRPDGER